MYERHQEAYMKILSGNVRCRDKKTHKMAVLFLAMLLAGTGIVSAYTITDLRVLDKENNLSVDLSHKDNLIHTNSIIVVEGHLSPGLNANDHLWIAVKPDKSVSNWWPQINGELGDIVPNGQGKFQGNAFLGGDPGDVLTVAILILNDTLNRKFSEWAANSKNKKLWPAITEGDPINGTKVSKNTIENNILAEMRIALKENRTMLKYLITDEGSSSSSMAQNAEMSDLRNSPTN
jgi:hypothetical protein